eukprot:6214692-Pleurochrysis_carterae.AAC.2
MNCAPEACAARSSAVVRHTTSLVCASSRACWAGTSVKPRALSRSRMGSRGIHFFPTAVCGIAAAQYFSPTFRRAGESSSTS